MGMAKFRPMLLQKLQIDFDETWNTCLVNVSVSQYSFFALFL